MWGFSFSCFGLKKIEKEDYMPLFICKLATLKVYYGSKARKSQ